MEQTLSDLLLRETFRTLSKQRSNGAFPPGNNGPYNDPETPTRNTSHWLVTLSRLLGDTFPVSVPKRRRDDVRSATEKAIAYLTSDDCRPYEETFLHRKQEGKDRCNGLIGQAWTIEGLTAAADVFDRPELQQLAVEVFLTHPFDEQVALWQRVDVDGSVLGFDRTFNHQLWFAAAGSQLATLSEGKVDSQIVHFLDHLPRLIDLTEDGMIRHLLRPDFDLAQYVRLLVDNDRRELCRNGLLYPIRPPSNKRTLR